MWRLSIVLLWIFYISSLPPIHRLLRNVCLQTINFVNSLLKHYTLVIFKWLLSQYSFEDNKIKWKLYDCNPCSMLFLSLVRYVLGRGSWQKLHVNSIKRSNLWKAFRVREEDKLSTDKLSGPKIHACLWLRKDFLFVTVYLSICFHLTCVSFSWMWLVIDLKS